MPGLSTALESFELSASIKLLEHTLKTKMLQAAQEMHGGYNNVSDKIVNEIETIQAVIDNKTKRLATLTMGSRINFNAAGAM
jgi:hypothetical protein